MSASPLPTPTTIPPTWKALAEACQDEELVDWQARCKSAGVRYTTYTKRIRRDSRWWEYLLSELLPCDQERKVNVLLLEQALQRIALTGKGMSQLGVQAASILLAREDRKSGFHASVDISAGSAQEMQALQAAVALRLGPPPSGNAS